MTIADRWLLPDGMEEILPPKARQMEALRRRLLDLFHAWGYDMVMPPPVEFLESLLTGAGHDLELQTFKVTDQLSGRTMGVSADVTPQVARMDAHSVPRSGAARFCYCHPVLRTRADNSMGSRAPVQIGAELFGHAGVASDLEILNLMVSTLQQSGADELYLDLGHVGLYRGLVDAAGLSAEQEQQLFDAIQHKRFVDIAPCVTGVESAVVREMLMALPHLSGGVEVLEQARQILAAAPAGVREALSELTEVAYALQRCHPEITLYLDLSELRGYHYHTGMVFAAYVPGLGQALAKGGRYDEIGSVFGRARPATGFSTDLKLLAELNGYQPSMPGILAPVEALTDPDCAQEVARLRAMGERVMIALPEYRVETHQFETHRVESGQGVHQAPTYDRRLLKVEDQWQVVSAGQSTDSFSD